MTRIEQKNGHWFTWVEGFMVGMYATEEEAYAALIDHVRSGVRREDLPECDDDDDDEDDE